MIIAQSDPHLELDARASGFFYLRYSDEQAIVQGALEAMARENPKRRWRRLGEAHVRAGSGWRAFVETLPSESLGGLLGGLGGGTIPSLSSSPFPRSDL